MNWFVTADTEISKLSGKLFNLLDFRFALMDRYGMRFNFACRRCKIELHNLAL